MQYLLKNFSGFVSFVQVGGRKGICYQALINRIFLIIVNFIYNNLFNFYEIIKRLI